MGRLTQLYFRSNSITCQQERGKKFTMKLGELRVEKLISGVRHRHPWDPSARREQAARRSTAAACPCSVNQQHGSGEEVDQTLISNKRLKEYH